MKELLARAHALRDQIVADRRAIHAEPELMYQETKTAGLVAARLSSLGLKVRTGVGRTGVAGLLHGSQPGRTVLLRADMDALPILEPPGRDYASRNHGVMHACGHDAHTAMLLGAAELLAARREELRGAVKFMFQPAEEGGAGAMRMIEDGVLDAPPVHGAFALHVDPRHYAGQVGARAGAVSAAAERFTITVHGRGGHAARPEGSVDPVVIAAHIVSALQTLVSREVAPAARAVVTIGSIVAGETFNVIPDTAVLKGTIRTYSRRVQRHLQQRIPELAGGIAAAMRATATIEYSQPYPPVVNHQTGVDLVRAAATDLLGQGALVDPEPLMGSEDFSFILDRVPGCFFRLGVRDRSWAEPRPTHNPRFDLCEDALPVGAAMMAAIAVKFLGLRTEG